MRKFQQLTGTVASKTLGDFINFEDFEQLREAIRHTHRYARKRSETKGLIVNIIEMMEKEDRLIVLRRSGDWEEDSHYIFDGCTPENADYTKFTVNLPEPMPGCRMGAYWQMDFNGFNFLVQDNNLHPSYVEI